MLKTRWLQLTNEKKVTYRHWCPPFPLSLAHPLHTHVPHFLSLSSFPSLPSFAFAVWKGMRPGSFTCITPSLVPASPLHPFSLHSFSHTLRSFPFSIRFGFGAAAPTSLGVGTRVLSVTFPSPFGHGRPLRRFEGVVADRMGRSVVICPGLLFVSFSSRSVHFHSPSSSTHRISRTFADPRCVVALFGSNVFIVGGRKSSFLTEILVLP